MRSIADVMTGLVRVLVLAGWMCCTLWGCEASQNRMTTRLDEPPSPPRVTLGAGDVVDVRFFYTPELNVSQTVRPDGKISLQLVGEVLAEGRSPDELRTELLRLYRSHLREPDVAVIVQSFYYRRVFVGGQVQKPGVIAMPGQLTALDAIMEAGGFILPQAQVGSVVIVRRRDDVNYAYCVNLRPALKGGESRPFYLEPQDVVYVPQTPITEIGQWVEQHINSLVPKTGLVVLSTSGNTTVGYDLR